MSGPYDIIATASGPDMNAVADVVNGKIQPVDGVIRTVTSLALETS